MARSALYHQANLIHGVDICAPNKVGFPTINIRLSHSAQQATSFRAATRSAGLRAEQFGGTGRLSACYRAARISFGGESKAEVGTQRSVRRLRPSVPRTSVPAGPWAEARCTLEQMTSFFDHLCGTGFPVSLEITPPRTSNPAILRRRAALLQGGSRTMNVIQRLDRQSSLEASIELEGMGFEPVWHLAVRGNTLPQVLADAERATAAGVGHVLCLLGDHQSDPGIESPAIAAAIRALAEAVPSLTAGATANQYVMDDKAWRNLEGKISAGARYVQTQPVFDADDLAPFAERLKSAHPDVCLVPMVMPLATLAAANAIQERLQIGLPEKLTGYLEHNDAESAWAMFSETLATLRDSPLYAGVAVMTFEMDAHADTGARICAALGE